MGLFDDDDLELDDLLESVKKYPSCVVDLNEGEVQAIFNRCVSKDYSSEKLFSDIFVPRSELRTVFFYKNNILQNKQSIQYLFGQLAGVHEGKQILTIDEFFKSIRVNNGLLTNQF